MSSEDVRCVNCGFPSAIADAIYDAKCVKCEKYVNSKASPDEKHLNDYGFNKARLCGCLRHNVTVGGDKVVLYQNVYWELRCLFVKVDKRMPKIIRKYQEMEKEVGLSRKMKMKFVEMKTFMRGLRCSRCVHPAGNRFTTSGTKIFCGACSTKGAV